jgi:hypothetical protein
MRNATLRRRETGVERFYIALSPLGRGWGEGALLHAIQTVQAPHPNLLHKREKESAKCLELGFLTACEV